MRNLKLLGTTAALFLLADAIFGFILLKKYFYPYSLDTWSYLVQSSDAISLWTGRVTWLVVVIFYICLPLLLGRKFNVSDPAKLAQICIEWVKASLSKKIISFSLLSIDTAILAAFAYLYIVAPHLAPLPAGRMILSTDPGSRMLYIAEPHNILVYDLSVASGTQETHQNFPYQDPSNIQFIAASPDEKLLYASDYGLGIVHILDTTRAKENPQHLEVGRTASALALSGDGRKLYVGVIGPPPEGKIDVFRTDSLEQVGQITGIGCPVGLSASANAPLLFVVTQCGGGHDLLYVIDTKSDEVVDTFPDFAVGSSVVATPDGKTAFVSTGDKLKILSGYRTPKQIISEMPMPVSTLALTPDGTTLLVGTPPGIRAMNVATLQWCTNTVNLETEPSAIAIGVDGTVAAMLPKRMFITDLKAIECKN